MPDHETPTRPRPSFGWSLLVALGIFVVWIVFSMESDYGPESQRHDLWFGVLAYAQVTAYRPAPSASWSFDATVDAGRLLWSLVLSAPIAWVLWRGASRGLPRPARQP